MLEREFIEEHRTRMGAKTLTSISEYEKRMRKEQAKLDGCSAHGDESDETNEETEEDFFERLEKRANKLYMPDEKLTKAQQVDKCF